MSDRIWLKGDTHLHTVNSDGELTKGQLVEKCKALGLDFAIITDHNFHSVEHAYLDGDLLVMQGQEITGDLGHVNIWGKKIPVDPPYALNNAEDYQHIMGLCRKEGATISINHPFCSMCGFHLDLEAFDYDCVEVWNTLQHSDNMKNMDWWETQLLKGKHLAAVGGSDFHKDYYKILKLLAVPTTITHAKSKSEADILAALREGRSVVTNRPDTSMLYLTCGKAGLGDTVAFEPGVQVSVKATDLKRGHTLRVFNNEKIVFEYKADSDTAVFGADVTVKEPGFVRAEIRHTWNSVMKMLYKKAEGKFLDTYIDDIPPFIWAFTNPIWFA